ncbi:sigma-70 family RNA polymerase sigma factor [Hymenobacter sp. YC55]|uniref:RNA polymerase sigma factor n=1 Tax=Hymenobacter sp. YC55 TaxID=3034019 RepID=UPI0023F8B37B|nr:sigma-70 family RNA polymerase sigma factor [Hymenobacter sp. YC55]MDF7815070.1 sigma-70 family RNA polymerase sigma factor [Hymenobacter sp. YC55]
MPANTTAETTPVETDKIWSARALRDLTLVEAALQGHANAYEELVQRYRKPVYYTIFKMVRQADDADDLTSETFAKAFRNLPRFRPEFAFSTWLFRIATNASIDSLRRKRLKTLSLAALSSASDDAEVGWNVSCPDPTPQEAMIRQQRAQAARQVVDQLPAKYARLVRLRYFDELSYEEVATELHLPIGTVKAQLFKARELLLELLQASKQSL